MVTTKGQLYGSIARKGFLWATFGRFAGELVVIPAAMVLARMLTPREFGIVAAAMFFIQIATRVTNFGLNTALVQAKELRPDHLCTVFWVNVGSCLAMWVALTLSAPWLGTFFNSPEAGRLLPIAGLTFVIGSFGSVQSALLSRALRFETAAVIEAAATLANAVASIALAALGFGYWSLVYGQIVSMIVQVIVRTAFTGWLPGLAVSWSALRELFAFGMGVQAKRLLDSTALNIDNLVVGRALGMSALGIYDRAFTTMNRAVLAMSTVGPAVTFRIFALIQDDTERFRRGYRRVLLTAALIAHPVFVVLAASAPDLFLVMFGPRWQPAVLPFQILCLTGMFKLLLSYTSTAIQAKGRIWGEVWRQLLYIGLIAVGVFGGSRFGLPGAAVGVLVATGVMFVLMNILLRRVAQFSWGDLLVPQVPGALCAAGVGLVVVGVGALLQAAVPGAPVLIALGVQYIAAGLFYVAFLFWSGFAEVRLLVEETVEEFAPKLMATLRA